MSHVADVVSHVIESCSYVVQLADFGLTRVLDVDKKTHVSTQTYGTVAYMPPELLSSSRLTKAVRPMSHMCEIYVSISPLVGQTSRTCLWEVIF